MKTSNTILAIAVLIVAAGIVWYVWPQNATAPNGQLANPASVHCTQTLGGTLTIVDEAGGQGGACHLANGRVGEGGGLYRSGPCTTPPAGTPASPGAGGPAAGRPTGSRGRGGIV